MPAASWIGLSATISCIVEQLGLAMMPLWASSASGLTSETTSGISGSRRKAEELSTTTQPAAAKRGAHAREVVAPAEKIAMSKPWIDSSLSAWTISPPSSSRPAERSEANGTISLDREVALAQLLEHHGAHRAGGAHDGDAQAHGLKGCSGRTSSAPSSNASCRARTACGDAVGLRRRRRS